MLILGCVLGLCIGVVVGALGAGGGILSVPVLVYLLGVAPHNATASSLVIVGLTALVSLFSPGRSTYVKYRDGAVFGLLAIAGSVLGARTSEFVPADLLMYLFSGLLICVGIVMFRKGIRECRVADSKECGEKSSDEKSSGGQAEEAEKSRRENEVKLSWWLVVAAALGTGMLTGFFGVGGGFIVVPMLMLVLRMPMREAASTSLLIMVITSISGLLARIGTSVTIDWPVIMAFAVASMIGGFAGGPLTARVRPAVLTICFGLLLLCVAYATAVATAL